MPYAQDTSTPVENSKAEIERTLVRYGASQFVSGWDEKKGKALVQFDLNNRRIRFTVDIPLWGDFKTYKRNTRGGPRDVERSDGDAKKAAQKEARRRWRSLNLVVKSKLESVESGIASFEEEFMPYIVTASGQTIGEMILPKLDKVANSGKLPPLLPGHIEDE